MGAIKFVDVAVCDVNDDKSWFMMDCCVAGSGDASVKEYYQCGYGANNAGEYSTV